MSDPLWDPTAPGDDGLRGLERALAPLRHDAPLAALPARRRRRAPIYAGAVIVAAAAAAAWLLWPRAGDPCAGAGFHFEATEGVATCQGSALRAGTVPVGGVLETGAGDRAHVEVADIGAIDLDERSKLSLVTTGPAEHRLSLERGSLHAKVDAPPRLFVVDTPSASAVDLGCEYDLSVAPDGSGLLHVTNGKVELATPAMIVEVPMNASARMIPGHGPGTPWADTAAPRLQAAIERFDRGDATAFGEILVAAAKTDTVTLFHLLATASPGDRARIFDAIDHLLPIPPWVERDRVIAGDAQAIDELHQFIEPYWFWPDRIR